MRIKEKITTEQPVGKKKKKKKLKRGIKNILRQMKMETEHTKTCGIQ